MKLASQTRIPAGFLAFTLHAHLPWVVHHGTWPHGMEWLHEAAAETYLPLLRMLTNLERDGIPANLNISLSPVLLEQLSHPTFQAEFPKYLTRKIVASREDEAFFIQAGEHQLAETARFWHRFFATALEDFEALDGRIVDGFRRFQDAGSIEILTSGATHGYMPLLGTDESVRAQIRAAITAHTRHIGRAPRGIWVPECGYRPAGRWEYPVADSGSTETEAGYDRIGLEQALAESGLEYFFVDTHLVEQCYRARSPYAPVQVELTRQEDGSPLRSVYHTWTIDGGSGMEVFPRDPRTGLQVWSGESGYPGEPRYLDFHKKRFPGGHRYWEVTGQHVDLADKQQYRPQDAAERVRAHAEHFVSLVRETLEPYRSADPDRPVPVLSAPFDAELFGHWWFEGPQWLESVCRLLHQQSKKGDLPPVETIQCSSYRERFPAIGTISMKEGSWGAEGDNQVWLNPDTTWVWSHIYAAEHFVRNLATELTRDTRWKSSEVALRVVRQLCRELLLLESSDWEFLITTGAARDYAEMRFTTHNDQFADLRSMWESMQSEANADGQLTPEQLERLAEIERRDPLFPNLDPALWAEGACDVGKRPTFDASGDDAMEQPLSAD